jgi:hypothetical protein
MSSSDEKVKIEAAIAEAQDQKREALKAGRDALAADIQKQIVVLQEDLRNEREHQRKLDPAVHKNNLELAKASAGPGD